MTVSGILTLTIVPAIAQDYDSVWEAASGLTPEETCLGWVNKTGTRPSLIDGHLTISTDDCATNRYYEIFDPDLVFPDPAVVEFVARLVSSDECPPCQGRRAIGVNVQPEPMIGVHLWVGNDAVLLNHSQNPDCDDYTAAFVDTDDDFHTYRIEVTGEGAVTVYYDESWLLSGHTFIDPTGFG
jgi:hypothetical protein